MRTATKRLSFVLLATAMLAPAEPVRAAKKPARTPAEKQRLALVAEAFEQLKAGETAAARAALDRSAAVAGIAAERRFESKVLAAGAAPGDPAALRKAIRREVAAAKASPAAQADAFDQGAKRFNGAGRYGVAREFLRLGAALRRTPPKNTYRCRFRADVPLGAAGWALSKLIDDPAYREARFGPYDKAHAERLVTDVSGDRGVQKGGGADKNRGTAFAMVYDARGWHIFVVSQEPDIEGIRNRGARAGALEMAFSPGSDGACYYQWIADLAGNTVSLYDWDSPHRHFRSLKGKLRCETVALGGAFGTYIFIPWEALYDKLPLAGGRWPFSVIRWKTGGGVTWGGKVHEIGRWGLVAWDKPTDPQKRAIQLGIVQKAWGAYGKSRSALTRRWQDPEVGDPAFYREAVEPMIRRLDEQGKALKDPEKLSAADVTRLFDRAVPHWMEFGYDVSEARSEYLRKRLLAP